MRALGFSREDFEKMGEIAERVRPDVVFFSSLEPRITDVIQENIRMIQQRLKPYRIRAEWRQLAADVLEPSPVR